MHQLKKIVKFAKNSGFEAVLVFQLNLFSEKYPNKQKPRNNKFPNQGAQCMGTLFRAFGHLNKSRVDIFG